MVQLDQLGLRRGQRLRLTATGRDPPEAARIIGPEDDRVVGSPARALEVSPIPPGEVTDRNRGTAEHRDAPQRPGTEIVEPDPLTVRRDERPAGERRRRGFEGSAGELTQRPRHQDRPIEPGSRQVHNVQAIRRDGDVGVSQGQRRRLGRRGDVEAHGRRRWYRLWAGQAPHRNAYDGAAHEQGPEHPRHCLPPTRPLRRGSHRHGHAWLRAAFDDPFHLTPDIARRLPAVVGVFRQARLHDLLQGGRRHRFQGGDGSWVAGHDRRNQTCLGLALEGFLARRHLVDDCTKCEEVSPRIGIFTL